MQGMRSRLPGPLSRTVRLTFLVAMNLTASGRLQPSSTETIVWVLHRGIDQITALGVGIMASRALRGSKERRFFLGIRHFPKGQFPSVVRPANLLLSRTRALGALREVPSRGQVRPCASADLPALLATGSFPHLVVASRRQQTKYISIGRRVTARRHRQAGAQLEEQSTNTGRNAERSLSVRLGSAHRPGTIAQALAGGVQI